MSAQRMPTQVEFDTALWLSGEAAIEVATAAEGAPDWPPLMRSVGELGPEVALMPVVQLDEAHRARAARVGLDSYWYPVPRARVERAQAAARYAAEQHRLRSAAGPSDWSVWWALLESAMRGESGPLRHVALKLAVDDRKTRLSEPRVSRGSRAHSCPGKQYALDDETLTFKEVDPANPPPADRIVEVSLALPAMRKVASALAAEWEGVDLSTLPPVLADYLRVFGPRLMLRMLDFMEIVTEIGDAERGGREGSRT